MHLGALRHSAQVVVKTRHSDNSLAFKHILNFGSVACHDSQRPPWTTKTVSPVSLSDRGKTLVSPPALVHRQFVRSANASNVCLTAVMCQGKTLHDSLSPLTTLSLCRPPYESHRLE